MGSTWLQLRQAALMMLDQDPNLTGDVADQVDYWLEETHKTLTRKRRPRALIREATLDVTEASNSPFSIASDFAVTDFSKEMSLSVDEAFGVTGSEAREWRFLQYQAWVGNNSYSHGNLNHPRSWTITPDEEVLLSSLPTGDQTWRIYLYYLAPPAAFVEGNEPELHEDYQRLIAIGAALMFPHFFQGNRSLVLTSLRGELSRGIDEMLRDRGTASKESTLHIRDNRRTYRGPRL